MSLDPGQRKALESFARQGTRRINRARLAELIDAGLVADHGDSHSLTDAGEDALKNNEAIPKCAYLNCTSPQMPTTKLGLCRMHDQAAQKILHDGSVKRHAAQGRNYY